MRTGYLRRGRDVTAGRQPSRGAVQWWILRELPAGRREEQLREHYPPLAASATLLSCQFEPPARDSVPSQPTRITLSPERPGFRQPPRGCAWALLLRRTRIAPSGIDLIVKHLLTASIGFRPKLGRHLLRGQDPKQRLKRVR